MGGELVCYEYLKKNRLILGIIVRNIVGWFKYIDLVRYGCIV